ncbi:hypothetical protein THAOC_16805 [Thalassiosira oceanica]|uniref:Uncharacterized protein n=1 Tax=Thalassiosira oceanica TaxID=159749 RepID=K0SB94_THAOC|nr:hypothetical protein THAOC_16805 [Thalassiosira oceanica]|eukprot:EJK62585.1 hypothetical protein THAOC_16805 [Thalassiosira oceanica]
MSAAPVSSFDIRPGSPGPGGGRDLRDGAPLPPLLPSDRPRGPPPGSCPNDQPTRPIDETHGVLPWARVARGLVRREIPLPRTPPLDSHRSGRMSIMLGCPHDRHVATASPEKTEKARGQGVSVECLNHQQPQSAKHAYTQAAQRPATNEARNSATRPERRGERRPQALAALG